MPNPSSRGLPQPKPDNDPPFSIYVASGPYTPDTDLLFKPWRNLLKNMKNDKPTVVLLIGPFIDVQHPKIKNGETDMVPTGLFRSLFVEPLRLFLDSNPGSIAILVPSIRDIVSSQAVFPQGELSSQLTGSDPRIHLVPNPACFLVNDITFAVTSVDAIYHVRKEEFVKRAKEVDSIPSPSAEDTGSDAMVNTCRQFLQQRSVTHLDGLKFAHGKGNENYAPDILVLPSRLKQFSKAVHSTTAVNPSFLVKGTYAKLSIAARATVVGIKERITAEVVKLDP
ncbi:hypothetical protein H0H81_002308 [Sphagnurus paluster]|uniref:DNA polymerase alpha subunit B n=1 Tax=Sphagnurus paluster TaxID=117069 RepID=A0A9P7FVK0_9AGAR|nr:hypothetical protein H0H81_002308 [Sphagnurus paluster]